MCTCGSMKPGKTSLSVASITSAPGGAGKSSPIARDGLVFNPNVAAAPSIRCDNLPALDQQSHFRSPPRRKRAPAHHFLVNLDAHLFAIRLHRLPVLGHLWSAPSTTRSMSRRFAPKEPRPCECNRPLGKRCSKAGSPRNPLREPPAAGASRLRRSLPFERTS